MTDCVDTLVYLWLQCCILFFIRQNWTKIWYFFALGSHSTYYFHWKLWYHVSLSRVVNYIAHVKFGLCYNKMPRLISVIYYTLIFSFLEKFPVRTVHLVKIDCHNLSATLGMMLHVYNDCCLVFQRGSGFQKNIMSSILRWSQKARGHNREGNLRNCGSIDNNSSCYVQYSYQCYQFFKNQKPKFMLVGMKNIF
jgi:hypothetical protein